MMHRIKYSKSLVESGGTVVVSDVGGGVFSSAAMGSMRFFNTGGGITTKSSSLVKRVYDMFRTGDIPNLFRGRQTGGCVSSFVPHQCNKSHMLPYFARALTFSSASESSGQTPSRQEPTKKGECRIIRSSKIQRERCDDTDEISSIKVSLNQSSGLMVHGMIKNSKTRRVLRWNHDTCYYEVQEVAAAAANHHARAFASSSASQSSGQTPRQEPTKKKRECQMIRSSKIQRERCDKISSTEVSLNQFPGLMVHGMKKNSKTRRLLRMNPDTGYFEEQDVAAAAANHHGHYDLQVPNRHVCRGSAYGWLFVTDDNLDMKLLNPFSGAEIQLPPVKTLPPSEDKEPWPLSKWFVHKAVFSANPSIEPRPVVLIIYGGQRLPRLAFCKPGDKGWTPLEFPKIHELQLDALYHKGQFYVLGWPGYIVAFDIGRCIDDDDHSVKTVVVATPPKRTVRARDWYLVVLDGELLRFELMSTCPRKCCCESCDNEMWKKLRIKVDEDTTDEDCCFVDYSDSDLKILYSTDEETDEESESEESDGETYRRCDLLNLPLRTFGIKIRRFDASEKQWVKVESLGDKAVFLGYNTSFALSASDYPAGVCIPDSVYFNFGGGGNESTEKPFYDMGVYNVTYKTVKPIYPPMHNEGEGSYYFLKPAPIWIFDSANLPAYA